MTLHRKTTSKSASRRLAELVGGDGGDVELRVVAIAGAQRGLEVEDLVVAARGARIAVDDQDAQIAAHLDAREAAVVVRQRVGGSSAASSCTPISLSFVDAREDVEEALLRACRAPARR